MTRTFSIASCALACAVLGPVDVEAQPPPDAGPVPKKVVQRRAETVKKKQSRSYAALLAKGSPALQRYLLRSDDWGRKLIAHPELQRELAGEPELLRRLNAEGVRALKDPAFVARVLEYEGVMRVVLDDEGAQRALERELHGYRAKLVEAEMAVRRGDQRDAAARFEEAVSEARELGNRAAQAEALLGGARALETLDRQHAKPGNAETILGFYDAVIEVGGPPQRALARNNKGVALLGQGRGNEAIAELERVDYGAVQEGQQQVFRYNLARAYEKEGREPQAIETYRGIVEIEPSFRPAVDRLFGLLRESREPERIHEAAVLTRDLVQHGEYGTALENARSCLDEWKTERAVPAICEVLVRSYVDGRITPADYARTEKALLTRVARGAQEAPTAGYLRRFAAQLQLAYEGELGIHPGPELARELFPTPSEEWSAQEVSGVDMPKELSRLLKLAGDHYDGGGDSKQALARYLLSWNLDPDNTEALVYVAEMVRQDEELLRDRTLLDPLVNRIFGAKGAGYRVQYKTAQDWLNILRYHVLLASIFEKLETWGSPHDVPSVVFQLEHAIKAEQKVRELGGEVVPSPGLHYRLGRAYVASGGPRDLAWSNFVRAARGFLRDANAKEARIALEAARGLNLAGDEHTQRLRDLETRIERLEDGR